MNTPDLEADWRGLLSSYPPAVRRLAVSARALIAKAVPQAVQRVRVGWKLLGFSAPNYFACVAPDQDRVRIGFAHGVVLDDGGTGLLEGTGTQMRWIVLRRSSDLKRAGITPLVIQAAELVPPRTRPRSAPASAGRRRSPRR